MATPAITRCCIIIHGIGQTTFKALSVTASIKPSLATTLQDPPSFPLLLTLLPLHPLIFHFVLRNHDLPRRRIAPSLLHRTCIGFNKNRNSCKNVVSNYRGKAPRTGLRSFLYVQLMNS
jgi:hypothetical protein